MTEIITGAERTTGADSSEPKLTISELHALLRDAAALERASRPIVIRSSAEAFGEQPVTVTPTALDFGGRYPSPAEAAGIVPMAPLRRPIAVSHWGARLGYAGVASLLAGAGSGVVVGTAALPVAAIVVGLGAIVGGVARGVHEENRENGR